MQSKTSFCNPTVLKKNLTRFAPVWIVYTICLILGIILLYTNGGRRVDYHFASNMTDLINVMGIVNLGYGLLVAQLLYGDLFSSRMCNALHALPLRRECWFVTHFLSGLLFSLVPTFVMALLSVVLLSGSLIEGAWALAWWVFLASNLEFLCFFGLAVFAAMATGNRFTMCAGYVLLNFGALIAYWLIDAVYTPLLYGVITPTALAENLTPIWHMTTPSYFEMDPLGALMELFGEDLEGATTAFALTDQWWRLLACAGAGVAFALAALLLYRVRNLECAGDAVAFPILVPVFQVLCSVVVAASAQFTVYALLGVTEQKFLFLSVGLVIGWFVGKMLVERSTRVFRLQNFYGLAALAAAFGLSLALTHFDVLGIETYIPDADKIQSVTFGSDWTGNTTLEKPEEIADVLRLQQLALDDRAEQSGAYIRDENGQWVFYEPQSQTESFPADQCTFVVPINLNYQLENGKLIKRTYNVWVDNEAGALAEAYLTRWDHVNYRVVNIHGKETKRLEQVLNTFENFTVSTMYGLEGEENTPEIVKSKAAALELLAAIQADCAGGNMAQHPYFHKGYFRYENMYMEDGIARENAVYISFRGETYGWGVDVYADSENTIAWLQRNGLLEWEIVKDETIQLW